MSTSQDMLGSTPHPARKRISNKQIQAEIWGDLLVGTTITRIARLANLSPAFVCDVFNGRRGPGLQSAFRLGPVLGITIHDLFHRNAMAKAMRGDGARRKKSLAAKRGDPVESELAEFSG